MGLVILSLCDGISTGQQVLKELGIDVDTYYASEIEKSAIKATQYHFPNTIQVGDLLKISYDKGILYTENGKYNVPKIDLILSGTPCVSFSVAGKKDNMNGVSGFLFNEFVRVLNEVKPTYFFFENVKMRADVASEINNKLNVEYKYINSGDICCHVRKRYYWTNILVNKEILKINNHLEDIIDESLEFNENFEDLLKCSKYGPVLSRDGIICINPKGIVRRQTVQRSRVYDIKGKCPTICASLYDLKITKDHKSYRRLSISECEKLQGLPVGYTAMLSKQEAGKALGNGWQVDTVKYFLQNLKDIKGV